MHCWKESWLSMVLPGEGSSILFSAKLSLQIHLFVCRNHHTRRFTQKLHLVSS